MFNVIETSINNLYLIEPRVFQDNRGSFRMTFVKHMFEEKGLVGDYVQTNISISKYKHTLRGLHFQNGKAAQDKLVRCIKGRLLDVVIDLRPGSQTFKKWEGFELSPENERQLFVPKGFAHSFITLEDDTHIMYQVSTPYVPEAEGGVRWNDPTFKIDWPTDAPILSEKDAAYPDFDEKLYIEENREL